MVINARDITSENNSARRIGGKAKNLVTLTQSGFNVPDFFVLQFHELLKIFQLKEEDITSLYQSNKDIGTPYENKFREFGDQLVLNKTRWTDLEKLLDSKFGLDYCISIRSSVTLEDGLRSSFAGLFESELFVTHSNFESALKNCFLSLFSPRVLEYSRVHHIDVKDNQINLVFQQMVDPLLSGVIFTMDINGNYDDMLLSVAYGTGDKVVDNTGNIENYYFNRNTKQSYALLEDSGTILSDDQIEALANKTLEIESQMGYPQDIEFCIDRSEQLWILQSRPISTINLEKIKILDNSNIVESYPGITLPLSFSFAQYGYEQVFAAAARLFKVPEQNINDLDPQLSEMIHHFKGRVYYNLHHWYMVMQKVISSKKSLNAWENLIGIQSKKKVKRFGLKNKIKTVHISLLLLFKYKSLIRGFYSNFKEYYGEMRTYIDRIEAKNPKEIFEFYRQISDRLFKIWAPTLLNDFFTFKSFDLLDRFTQKYADKGCSVNDLICGIPNVESEELFQALLKIVEGIKKNPDYQELFKKENGYILKHMDVSLKKEIDEFIRRYGDRTLEELKMESPNFRMKPERLIALIKTQMNMSKSACEIRHRQNELREGTEGSIRKRISKSLWKRFYFGWILTLTRTCIRNRENMRLQRARAYGAVKELFYHIALKLEQTSVLQSSEDIYYLSIEELEALVNLEMSDLYERLKKRKREFNEFRDMELPNRIIYEDLPPIIRPKTRRSQESNGRHTGLRISKGRIQAECIVLHKADIEADVDGKILITKMTDPAWVYLMTRAAGIVSETGSPLSHTAIVGRELGIPVLINVKSATHLFKSGDHVLLNADEAWVEKTED